MIMNGLSLVKRSCSQNFPHHKTNPDEDTTIDYTETPLEFIKSICSTGAGENALLYWSRLHNTGSDA